MRLEPYFFNKSCYFHHWFALKLTIVPYFTFVHSMYSSPLIPEHQRIATTRFSLSSHNLLVEKRPWSRVPRERRVCQCNRLSIQDEFHVVNDCHQSDVCRKKFQNTMTFPKPLHELFDTNDDQTVCEFIGMVTSLYQ